MNRSSQPETLGGLARLLASGLPPDQCLEVLAGQAKGKPPLVSAARRVGAGTPLPRACREAGLITPRECRWLEAAAAAGDLAAPVAALAEARQRRRRQALRLRNRLVLPAAVLLVGALAAPLPALVAGSLDAPGYLLRAGAPLLAAAALGAALTSLARRLAARETPGLDRLLICLPGLGPMVRLSGRAVLFRELARLREAGLAADQALALALDGLTPRALARRWAPAVDRVRGGGGLVVALDEVGALSPEDRALLLAGEQAGGLEDALGRRSRTLAEDLDHLVDLALGAVPWLCYALVLAWVGSGLGALLP